MGRKVEIAVHSSRWVHPTVHRQRVAEVKNEAQDIEKWLDTRMENIEFVRACRSPQGVPYVCTQCGFIKHKRVGVQLHFDINCPIKKCKGILRRDRLRHQSSSL